ncbi:hypothetical protein ACHHYP_20732 [Achlya hypogyna]|uniref:Uncharacterized protein n=1 Tax=Achlya hypogyna TaxID=1202772 RepID=A0A1V9YD96_ACHHY|nr:hypothetical protein ACHHYP_20732 [Achlya hypogyna]
MLLLDTVEWLLWVGLEKGSVLATFFIMFIATSVVAQYCEHHFVAFTARCAYVPAWLQAASSDVKRQTFYETFALAAIAMWSATVLAVYVWDLPKRTYLGLAYSCFTGGAFGLANFFQQYP